MANRDVAVGFLYHSASRKVLLHLRDVDKPPSAGSGRSLVGVLSPKMAGTCSLPRAGRCARSSGSRSTPTEPCRYGRASTMTVPDGTTSSTSAHRWTRVSSSPRASAPHGSRLKTRSTSPSMHGLTCASSASAWLCAGMYPGQPQNPNVPIRSHLLHNRPCGISLAQMIGEPRGSV
jgi:hypothetical protein